MITQTVPVSKNEQYTVIGGCKPCCDADNGFPNCNFQFEWENLLLSCKNNCVQKITNAPVRALPCGIVWVDEPSPFVVSGVANCSLQLIPRFLQ